MTVEDAKEMIKLIATDDGLIDVESVMKILDRVETSLSYPPSPIHPESEPWYGGSPYEKAPWWMNPNIKMPEPTCQTNKAGSGYDSMSSYTTATSGYAAVKN